MILSTVCGIHAQTDKCIVEEVLYYDNIQNNIETKFYHDTCKSDCQFTGEYTEYYENGNLKTFGEYRCDPLPLCLNCVIDDEEYELSSYAARRIGLWFTYHPNGNIESIGKYSPYVHEELVKSKGNTNGPNNVGLSSENLKTGNWSLFDSKGKLIKEDVYFEGKLTGTLLPFSQLDTASFKNIEGEIYNVDYIDIISFKSDQVKPPLDINCDCTLNYAGFVRFYIKNDTSEFLVLMDSHIYNNYFRLYGRTSKIKLPVCLSSPLDLCPCGYELESDLPVYWYLNLSY